MQHSEIRPLSASVRIRGGLASGMSSFRMPSAEAYPCLDRDRFSDR